MDRDYKKLEHVEYLLFKGETREEGEAEQKGG